ncbi:MAG: YbaB/EbfC family nucleoid-associated protein [Bdellovibrionota bacterium]
MKGLGMGGLMQQAQKMQQELKRIQDEAATKTAESSVGGGMVKVVANGKQEVVSIEIDPEVLKMNDKEMLQDLLTSGVNEALKSAHALVSEEMKGLMGGLGPLAGLFNS